LSASIEKHGAEWSGVPLLCKSLSLFPISFLFGELLVTVYGQNQTIITIISSFGIINLRTTRILQGIKKMHSHATPHSPKTKVHRQTRRHPQN
jgi:hypothetical protein